jgi:hypothetical protein
MKTLLALLIATLGVAGSPAWAADTGQPNARPPAAASQPAPRKAAPAERQRTPQPQRAVSDTPLPAAPSGPSVICACVFGERRA